LFKLTATIFTSSYNTITDTETILEGVMCILYIMYELIQESADNVRGEQQAAVRLIDTGRKSNRVRYLSEPYDSAVWSHRCPDEMPLMQAFYEMVEDILSCKEHDRDRD